MSDDVEINATSNGGDGPMRSARLLIFGLVVVILVLAHLVQS